MIKEHSTEGVVKENDSALFICEFARKTVFNEDSPVESHRLRNRFIEHFIVEVEGRGTVVESSEYTTT